MKRQINLYLPDEYSDHYRNGFHFAVNQMEEAKEKRIAELTNNIGGEDV